jgi:regulator of replication initiation timing
MADETETAETAETAETTADAPSTAELADRIDGVENKLELILSKLGGAKDQAHAAAQEHTEERLERPNTIAEQIRAQLADQQAAAAAETEKRSQSDRLAAVEERLTGMAEKPPEAPIGRVTRFMWGNR